MQQWRGLLKRRKASTCVRPLDRHDAPWNHPDRQVTAKPLTNMSKQTNWPWMESNSYRLDSGLQLLVLADALTIWASRPASLTTVHGVCVNSFNYRAETRKYFPIDFHYSLSSNSVSHNSSRPLFSIQNCSLGLNSSIENKEIPPNAASMCSFRVHNISTPYPAETDQWYFF